MNRILIAPDSFKGALPAWEFCRIVTAEAQTVFPGSEIVSVPLADGGEGTVDSLLSVTGGRRVELEVTGPLHMPVTGYYGLLPDGITGVFEVAAAAGLPLAAAAPNPGRTTTFGVGQLIRDAVLHHGVRRVLLGLGGSATNDGGCGLASALGVVFRDAKGNAFLPTGDTLKDICSIDPIPARSFLKSVTIQALCDVESPLYGPTGAAYVFSPQKGADTEAVARLDEGLRHYGTLLEHLPGGAGVSHLPGAGAAGGIGGGLVALLGASLSPGIDLLLDAVKFDTLLDDCSLVLTGEGRFDAQSLQGKAILGVCRRAAAKHVPVIALVGAVAGGESAAYEQGLTALFPSVPLLSLWKPPWPKQKKTCALRPAVSLERLLLTHTNDAARCDLPGFSAA